MKLTCKCVASAIIIATAGTLVGCGHFNGPKSARIWSSPVAVDRYPEQQEEKFRQEENVRGANTNNTFGIAFYGGGTRAAPAAIGQIRMMNELGWFEKASYVSTISGGTWGTAPYIFLPEKYYGYTALELCRQERADADGEQAGLVVSGNAGVSPKAMNQFSQSQEECAAKKVKTLKEICPNLNGNDSKTRQGEDQLYLGKYLTPDQIKNDNILATNATPDLYPYTATGIMERNSSVFWKAMGSWFWNVLGDEDYANVIGNIFLKDIGLYKTPGWFDRGSAVPFAYDKDSYPRLDTNWHYPRLGRPYLIAGTTLMQHSSNQTNYYRFEMTPLYTGVLGKHEIVSSSDGGTPFDQSPIRSPKVMSREYLAGYAESFAFDAKKAEDSGTSKKESVLGYHTAFSLSDMLAASGAAPAQALHKIGTWVLGAGGVVSAAGFWPAGGYVMLSGAILRSNAGFPEFRYSVVDDSQVFDRTAVVDWQSGQFGDGGHLENSGIMSLLARQVKRILVFVNSPTPFVPDKIQIYGKIDDNLVSLFQRPEYFAVQHGGEIDGSELMKVFKHYPHNGVFEGAELKNLLADFEKAVEQNEPLVSCRTYSVKKNNRYNIAPYEGAKICFVYLQGSKKWSDSLPVNEETTCDKDGCEQLKDLKYLRGDFKHFPNYKTFLDNIGDGRPGLIKKSADQSNALAQYTSWEVQQSACKIGRELELPLPMGCTE
jgi:hypothetical protein